MNVHYVLCITSCSRFDLLQQTLESFASCVNIKPRETIIVEDSDAEMPAFLKDDLHTWASKLGKIRWFTNGLRRGQVLSIDRLIAAIPPGIERVFWLEDDWTCDRTLDVNEPLAILDKHPGICQVVLRNDWPHTLVSDPRFPFKVAQPHWRGQNWGGWTWNPHLTRLTDLKRFGSYASQAGYVNGLKHEEVFSKKFLDAGYRIAALPYYFRHTGACRSRAIEPLPALPRILIAIPVCHEFAYGKYEGDLSKPETAKGYHQNGVNDRIAALRETWLKDVAAFPNVTYKLFYGGNGGREPLADEVFLPVGDNYLSLPAKTIAICKYAVEHNYEMVFKCDDDSLIYVDRILQEALYGLWDYAGYLNGRVCTGGTGYWLTKRAFAVIAEKATATFHFAEDVTVSHFLFYNNIQGVHLQGHRTGRGDHWFWPDGKFDPKTLPPDATAIHAVQPEVLREWYRQK